MERHAAHDTEFPLDQRTFAGDLMMRVAVGDEQDVLEQYVEDVTVHDDMTAIYDGPALEHEDALVVLYDVIAAYQRAVPRSSEHAVALESAFAALEDQGVVTSFGEGWDSGEAARDGFERASAAGARGYAYAHRQDLERLVETGVLYVGFSSVDAERGATEAVGVQVTDALRAVGLPAAWSGSAADRITVEPLQWERAYG